MNPSNAVHPGQHQPPPLQHPRSTGIVQHNSSKTPRQTNHPPPQSLAPAPQPAYYSPHPSTTSRPVQQSPLYAFPQHHPGETTFLGAHPSPYSSHSAAGSYASSEPNDNMAAQAAMSRQHYPPISSYQTPQSNSPASMSSPQTDSHGRPMYPVPAMPQQMYYQPQYMQPNPYSQHAPASQHHPLGSAPGMLMSQHQPQPQHQMHPHQHQHQHQQHHQHQQAHAPPPAAPSHHSQPSTGIVDNKPSPAPIQRAPSAVAPQHGTPQTPSSAGMHTLPPTSAGGPGQQPTAAPGPIPATTPLVVRQDHNGVQWIAFEYSRDRVKMEYTIRCDVESVNVDDLSAEFKSANCVYPRACCGKDQYKGNRLHYESECNAVGWALAQLNPPLREKRGLIQRAVDSWRNSNQDQRLRSRRVRRMAKMTTRKQANSASTGQMPGTPASAVSGLQNSQAPHDYNTAPAHHHQAPPNAHASMAPGNPMPSPRYTQNFYPSYPHQASGGAAPIPSVHHSMDSSSMRPPSSALAVGNVSNQEDDEEKRHDLFGNLPESKRRKFILVDDPQRNTRVRVRVMLDQVNMADMPDAHLKMNAVYPRSYYPQQMGSPGASSRTRSSWDDEDDMAGDSGALPTRGKTLVPVPLMDGGEAHMPVPRMTKSRRKTELTLNEIGCRLAWSQPRTFSERTLFLQRTVDGYRNKIRSTMVSLGMDVSAIAPHFETRPGKRKFTMERNSRNRKDSR